MWDGQWWWLGGMGIGGYWLLVDVDVDVDVGVDVVSFGFVIGYLLIFYFHSLVVRPVMMIHL
jgi:hypothetical protein